jgi:hypothetical protein
MEWTETVVARLAEAKRAGVPFERAWRDVLVECPPRGRDRGPAVPSLLDSEPSVVEFFHGACSDAWHGPAAGAGALGRVVAVGGRDGGDRGAVPVGPSEPRGMSHPRRNDHGLSRKQMYALIIMEETRQPGVVTSGPTAILDGQPWIHYRTAYSLHQRGLVRVHPYGEADAEVFFA